MANDWIRTWIQTVPRAGRVVRRLSPTHFADSAAAVDEEFLDMLDASGVVWDVDGTLMAYHDQDIAPDLREQLREAFKSSTRPHAILSNCAEDRFGELARIFPEIPIIRGYDTPSGPVFRSAWNGQDTHSAAEVRQVLDSGGQQIRKPDGRLIQHAARVLGLPGPDRLVMIGDQCFTDIAEANLGGALSVKVPTYRRDTFPLPIRVTQLLDSLCRILAYPFRARRPAP